MVVRSFQAAAPVPSITRTWVSATTGESTLTNCFTSGERMDACCATATLQVTSHSKHHKRRSTIRSNLLVNLGNLLNLSAERGALTAVCGLGAVAAHSLSHCRARKNTR